MHYNFMQHNGRNEMRYRLQAALASLKSRRSFVCQTVPKLLRRAVPARVVSKTKEGAHIKASKRNKNTPLKTQCRDNWRRGSRRSASFNLCPNVKRMQATLYWGLSVSGRNSYELIRLNGRKYPFMQSIFLMQI